jgi:hypothetical protein
MSGPPEPGALSRRDALKALAASVGALAVWPDLSEASAETFAAIQKAKSAPQLKFFTPAQYATVDALSDTIIPTDDHSPGASAARVADYIDLLLSESDATMREAWRAGLTELDAASQESAQAPFVKLKPPQRVTLLTALAANEAKPVTPAEQFFKIAKDATIRGYYTSEIGVQKELQYKGNQFLGEFVGCTHPEHGYVAPTPSAE